MIAAASPRSLDQSPDAPSLAAVFDLVLRDGPTLSERLLDERALPGLTRRMLALSALGLAAHGLVVGLSADALAIRPEGTLGALAQPHAALWMPPSLVLAFLGALGLCLPSFYFSTLLAGLDASFRLVTAQALRAQLTTAVLLLGTLPIHVSLVLAAALGLLPGTAAVGLGLMLPFVVGLLGVRAALAGFQDLLRYLPRTHPRRGRFLLRMILVWGIVYSAVAPVALYRIAAALGAGL